MDLSLSLILMLVGLPLLGVVISLTLTFSAKRTRALQEEDWLADGADQGSEKARLIIFCVNSGTKVIYGIVQAFLLAFFSGAFIGVRQPLDLGVSLPVFCAVCGGVNFVTAVGDGLLVAGAVKGRRLTTMEGFRKEFIKLYMVEFLAILGLLLSCLAILF